MPIPKATFRDLHWRPLLAITGLQRAQLPALLYKVNAGVKSISPLLLKRGPQRDPLLHRVSSIAKALNERATWDPTLPTHGEQDSILQDVTCHWQRDDAKAIPQKLGIEWGPHVLHQHLSWEGLMAANGRAPKMTPYSDAARTQLRQQVGRRAANSREHWRKMRRIFAERQSKKETNILLCPQH